MIPGIAIAMRVLACLWFALALSWANEQAYPHAAATFVIGACCFAYAELVDRHNRGPAGQPPDSMTPNQTPENTA